MMYIAPPESPSSALVSLVSSPYGFTYVDVGITPADLEEFRKFVICKTEDFNHFGDLSDLENQLGAYLAKIGTGSIADLAKRIAQIAFQVIGESGKETAWVGLRASTPTDKYDIPRWHMDGHYYQITKGKPQYKFVTTLIGPSTLFYPIPQESKELRRIIWIHMANRAFMNELCLAENIATPERGVGAFFLAGDKNRAAIHSEPPIHENRLFFSVVPCQEDELKVIKAKVLSYYTNSQTSP